MLDWGPLKAFERVTISLAFRSHKSSWIRTFHQNSSHCAKTGKWLLCSLHSIASTCYDCKTRVPRLVGYVLKWTNRGAMGT
jgi:hypothetical protein